MFGLIESDTGPPEVPYPSLYYIDISYNFKNLVKRRMGLRLNMQNCTTHVRANASDNLVELKDLVAQIKQITNRITKPPDELLVLQCDKLDFERPRLSRLSIRIKELIRLITAQSHSDA